MTDAYLQWLYLLLTMAGLSGEPSAEATDTTDPATAQQTAGGDATEKKRQSDSFDGDIYNGF